MKIEAKNKKQIRSGIKKRTIKREIERGITNYIAKGSAFIDQISNLKTIEGFNSLLNSTFKEGNEQGIKGDILEIFTNWIINNANDVFDFCVLNDINRSILHNKGIDPNETEEDFDLRKEILERFNIPDLDEGIDGYFFTKGGKIGAYQCKVRTVKKTLNINDDKLGTFFKLTSDTPHKLSDPTRKREIHDKFDFVVVISTAESVPDDYNNDDNIWILKEDLAKFINDFTEAYNESPFVQFSFYLEKIFEKDLLKHCGETYDLMPHQGNHKNAATKHYLTDGNSLGIMTSPTGTGKTRMIFETVFEVFPKGVHILAAPWISLLYQNLEDFLKYAKARGKEFDAAISYSSSENDRSLHSNGITRLKNEGAVATWLFDRDPNKISILFTTYASSEKLIDGVNLLLQLKPEFSFSSLTCDESHRTVGQKDSLWTKLVIPSAIPVLYKMFATATIREIGDMRKQLEKHNIDAVGMDDKKFFGDIFYNLTFKDAIKQKLICDFQIVVATETPEEIIKLRKKIHLNGEVITSDPLDSRQLIGLGMAHHLMKGGEIKKAIFFSSDNTRSARAHSGAESLFAPSLCSKDNVLFTSSYESSKGNKIDTIKAFGNSEMALLFNCQQIKEGIDVKSCDCIVFLDPKTSKIDITQAIGRALRIDSKNPDKIAKVILPVVAEFDENEKCVINDESFKNLQDFLTSIVDLDEEIRESFDILIEEVKGSKKSKPQKKGKLRFSKFEIFDFTHLEKIRIKILKSTGDVLWYSAEEVHEIVKKDHRFLSMAQYDRVISSGVSFRKDYYMFPKYEKLSQDEFYKKMGKIQFLGLDSLEKIRENLLCWIEFTVENAELEGLSHFYIKQLVVEEINKYCPKLRVKEKTSGGEGRKNNLNFLPELYQGAKGKYIASDYQIILNQYERKFGCKIEDRLIGYCDIDFCLEWFQKNGIKSKKTLEAKQNDELFRKEMLKLGIPSSGTLITVYGHNYQTKLFGKKTKFKGINISLNVLTQVYNQILKDIEDGTINRVRGGLQSYSNKLGLPSTAYLSDLFEKNKFPKIVFKKRCDLVDVEEVKKLAKVHSVKDICRILGYEYSALREATKGLNIKYQRPTKESHYLYKKCPVEKFVSLFESGFGWTEISKTFGGEFNEQKIKQEVTKFYLDMGETLPNLNDLRIARKTELIKSLLESGLSATQISKKLNESKTTVHRYLKSIKGE
jgi:superfamily II DNA or RNA helicase